MLGHRAAHIVLGAALVAMTMIGCVRRTLTINTNPQGAIITLNDEEIGSTPVSRDFTWYGDYDVVIRKNGFETLHTNVVVNRPWYQIPPADVFADVFWPGRIHDEHHHAFTLEPRTPSDPNDILSRALELRDQALTADDH